MSTPNRYRAYIGMGAAYVLVKAVFVALGHLHLGAIAHGLVPAGLTIAVGVHGLTNPYAAAARRSHLPLLLWLPVLVLIATPLYTYWKMDDQWLSEGRLPVLIIYAGLAIVQIVLAASIRSRTVSYA